MIHPDYQKYLAVPDNLLVVTMVTIIHPYHGTSTLYIPIEDFQSNVEEIIRVVWSSAATIIIQPAQ